MRIAAAHAHEASEAQSIDAAVAGLWGLRDPGGVYGRALGASRPSTPGVKRPPC